MTLQKIAQTLLTGLLTTMVTASFASGLIYTSAGAPDLSHYVAGQTRYTQVVGDLGKPVSMSVDECGNPTAGNFLVPLQGDTNTSNTVTSKVANTAKLSFLSSLAGHVGSAVTRIPVIGTAAAETTNASAVQAAPVGTGARHVWQCTIFFRGGLYDRGTCVTINRPVGPWVPLS